MNQNATAFEVVLTILVLILCAFSLWWTHKAHKEEQKYTEEEKRRLEQEKLNDTLFRDEYTTEERPWKAE